ncbi:MAG TPA: hypothetical protein VGO11_11170 [Chthoniobacteraceae bacterium]|jgi:hypothetical protein|nr:hypothetical protein [Chthoniobacteraceae bacterium]
MTPETELAHLRQEVAALRKQMKDLLHFITIEREKGAEVPSGMNLRCGVITFQNPHEPQKTQMLMGGSEKGPFVSLWDSKEKGRVILSVEKDEPRVTLYTGELKQAVLLLANPDDGCGLVAAYDNGRPRAFLKAGEGDSGCVSICHDDGHARITMRGTEDSGCLLAVSPDMQAVVKISSDGLNGGGLVVVNSPNGKPSAILTHGPSGGAVIVNGPDGQPSASLPDVGFDRGKREEREGKTGREVSSWQR